MAKRKNIACAMRYHSMESGNGLVIRNRDLDTVQLAWQPRDSNTVEYITRLTTRDARLLAKRINQFLDAGG